MAVPVLARAQLTYTTNGGAITITGCDPGFNGAMTIPDSTNGLPVTGIAGMAFYNCPNLTGVWIGTNLSSIAGAAFERCESLQAIEVNPDNSSYCSLNGVLFNKSQTVLVAFPGGVAGNYNIPNSVTNVGDNSFTWCAGLTSVTIPDSVTSIGFDVFDTCASLTNLVIGQNVTSIGTEALCDLTSLTSIVIPAAVTQIGDLEFAEDLNLAAIYFEGNAPSGPDQIVFNPGITVAYYLPGATGWGTTFGGVPTALWALPYPRILKSGAGFGIQPNGFGFTVSWATNVPVVVEACTNLAQPNWTPLATNSLASGTNYFSDPQWKDYSRRFYRVGSP